MFYGPRATVLSLVNSPVDIRGSEPSAYIAGTKPFS